jgi:hypothetical protein
MTKEHQPRTMERLPPRPVAVLRQALQAKQATPRPVPGSQALLDGRPADGAQQPVDQTAVGDIAVVFVIEPFPAPSELGLGFSDADGTGQMPFRRAVAPRGPDASDVEAIVAAMRRRNMVRRASRPGEALARAEDGEEQSELLRGKEPVKLATYDTFEEYLSRGLGLIRTYKHECDLFRASTEDIDPRSFADWLVATRDPFMKSGAWRVHRQAAIAAIYTIPSVYIDEAIGILNEYLQVGDDKGNRGAGSRANKGPSAEFMIYDHFQRLKRKLREIEASQVCLALRDWLDASICTGLRPMEWELAFIERHPDPTCPLGGQVWLHVVAARGEHGHGCYRSLDVSGFSVEAFSAVERTVQRSHVWTLSDQWTKWQGEVTKLFNSVCEELFPRMRVKYTLYSLRHQFISNMSAIYDRERVVAMSGHDVTGAQREHYIKRRLAWTEAQLEAVPAAVAEQVSRMRKRLRALDERREIKSMKDAARRTD